ncbi:hypothetical protein KTC96_06505 [Clostridium estertheticum]|uniref:hypothetical protein n=1 Tax=Clostridium estertheticum TaxID=238834 RepID=UPI001C7D0824|nr:hypothetical protein [Clostridium estertheticum]MBX4261314.1 hypothetical protein [Clostridium estertheticum]WLC71649.1 hypothetical protein KTC96_06505 [Clostridium estertheticum]
MNTGTCALCLQTRELKLSHIIPDFVGRHFKKTSPTGYLRNIMNPNKREQDLMKEYLLCAECEQRFSVFEREFAEKAFHPFAMRELKELNYEEWLKKFIISVHWRIGISGLNSTINEKSSMYPLYLRTLEEWRRYLLDLPNIDERCKHHIIFIEDVGIEYTLPIKNPDFFPVDGYTYRSLDFGVSMLNSLNQKYLSVWTKLPEGIAMVSNIIPINERGWLNTHVTNSGTIKIAEQQIGQIFKTILEIRCGMIAGMLETSKISEKQRSKIFNDIKDNIKKDEGNAKSKGLISLLRDHKSHEYHSDFLSGNSNTK